MNKLEGIICAIERSGPVLLVQAKCFGTSLFSLILDSTAPESGIVKDTPIELLFKENDLSLSSDEAPSISILNSFRARIISIKSDSVLTRVKLSAFNAIVYSLITTRSAKNLNLTTDMFVTGLIKPSSIILSGQA